jgi:hypothetical protein
MDSPHPLTALFDAVEARTGLRPQTRDNIAIAMDAYCRVAQQYPDLEYIARAGMAQLAPRVRADAKVTLAAITADPVNMETAYMFSMSELAALATVLFTLDLGDEHADVYRDVCVVMGEMLALSSMVSGMWQAERGRRVAARAHPPPRFQSTVPLLDDGEYYIRAAPQVKATDVSR